MQNQNENDSNSDEEKESIRHLMKESREQLSYAEEVYTQIKLGLRNNVVTGEVVGIDNSLSGLCLHIKRQTWKI